jgi:hypothetical protein
VKKLSAREKQRLAKMRRDPAGRLFLEINRYLRTVGWQPIVMGNPQIRGDARAPGVTVRRLAVGHYEFSVSFIGGRTGPKNEP